MHSKNYNLKRIKELSRKNKLTIEGKLQNKIKKFKGKKPSDIENRSKKNKNKNHKKEPSINLKNHPTTT